MSLADPSERLALEALLRWYVDMGADAVLDDAPHDRFIAPPTHASAPPTSEAARARPAFDAAPAPADAQIRQAEALAAGAASLDDLAARWGALPGLHLATTARMIPAACPAGAPVLLLGGAPETDDERAGSAFSGAAGRLLDAMLAAIGLKRDELGLAYVVPWRPPGGRPPTPLELSLCLPFARRLVALAVPRTILCLGERAAQPLLGTREAIGKLRGRWHDYEGEGASVKALVTFSPDYLLKQPLQKRRAWADLQMLADEIGP